MNEYFLDEDGKSYDLFDLVGKLTATKWEVDRRQARVDVLEQESAELRKKLQEAEDRAIRAEVALENMHAAMTKIASCPCHVSDTGCGACVSCIARAALGVEASNERMINREHFNHWKKKPEET